MFNSYFSNRGNQKSNRIKMEKITYQGKDYPIRVIANGAWIASTELQSLLAYADYEGEAEEVDDNICGYVDEEDFQLPDAELEKVCRRYGIID